MRSVVKASSCSCARFAGTRVALQSQRIGARTAIDQQQGQRRALCRAVFAVLATAIKLLRWKPSAVISTGGECAFATCMAAALTRKPLVLIEPNVFPGLVNRGLTPFARFVLTAFRVPERWIPRKKCDAKTRVSSYTSLCLRHLTLRSVVSQSISDLLEGCSRFASWPQCN